MNCVANVVGDAIIPIWESETILVMYAQITKLIGAVNMTLLDSSLMICVVYAVVVVLYLHGVRILITEKQICLTVLALIMRRTKLSVDGLTQTLSLRERCAAFVEVVRVVIPSMTLVTCSTISILHGSVN